MVGRTSGRSASSVMATLVRLAAAGVEQIQLTELVINQGVTRAGERANVGAGVVQHFGHLPGGRVVAKDADVPGAAREKIDLPADVDREKIRGLVVGNFHRLESRQRGHPERAGAAAAIVAPGDVGGVIEAEGRRQRRVGDVRGIRRELALIGHGQRQTRRLAAARRHRIQLGVTARGVARGAEQDAPPVRGPAHRDVGRRMVGDPMRCAAHGGNGEDVGVAVVLAGEGDGAAVGREHRRGLEADAVGQAGGATAAARHGPQIARIAEGDQFAAQSRCLEQVGLVRRRHGCTGGEHCGDRPRDDRTRHTLQMTLLRPSGPGGQGRIGQGRIVSCAARFSQSVYSCRPF